MERRIGRVRGQVIDRAAEATPRPVGEVGDHRSRATIGQTRRLQP